MTETAFISVRNSCERKIGNLRFRSRHSHPFANNLRTENEEINNRKYNNIYRNIYISSFIIYSFAILYYTYTISKKDGYIYTRANAKTKEVSNHG